MKHIYIRRIILVLACSLSLVCSNVANVFAENPYGIVYSGGEPLGEENVNTGPAVAEVIDRLHPLISGRFETIETVGDEWQDGFIKTRDTSRCVRTRYLPIRRNGQFADLVHPQIYHLDNIQYRLVVQISDVVLENLEDFEQSGRRFLSVAVITDGDVDEIGYLYVGRLIYANDKCTQQVAGTVHLSDSSESKMFVQTNIKLYRQDDLDVPYVSNGVYFRLEDIDARQSYKILNERDKLRPGNMYAKTASGLQPSIVAGRNMFVTDGNYIYASEYYDLKPPDKESDIYVPISRETQLEGLDVVFGFDGFAWSGVAYYARLIVVTYLYDDSTGIERDVCLTEDSRIGYGYQAVYESNVWGVEAVANSDYELTWVADVDVSLEDGAVIPAGDIIADYQFPLIIARRDINFYASCNHKIVPGPDPDLEIPDEPDAGVFTNKMNVTTGAADYVVPVALVVVLVAIGMIACIRRCPK